MANSIRPDVIVYACTNSAAFGGSLPRQWRQDDARVLVREVPCSGKVDAQYLLHVLEDGARGLCVVTCPKGECRLAQGNYRAQMRVRTIQRLLAEIGLEPERAEYVQCTADEQFPQRVREAVTRICALGQSPIQPENSEPSEATWEMAANE